MSGVSVLSPEQRRAAEAIHGQVVCCWAFGMMIAKGLMERAEARILLPAARKEAPGIPPQMLRDVLAHHLTAQTSDWEACRDRTGGAMWRALDPLVQAKAHSSDLIAAAHKANAEARIPPHPAGWKIRTDDGAYSGYLYRPFLRHEVNDLVRRKVATAMRQGARA